jgi:hypothetical protein
MKIGTSGKVSKFAGRPSSTRNVSGLNIWGGIANNENSRGSNGFGGKTPDKLATDKSNEQPTKSSNFTTKPNRGSIDYMHGSNKSSNENPKGWKQ